MLCGRGNFKLFVRRSKKDFKCLGVGLGDGGQDELRRNLTSANAAENLCLGIVKKKTGGRS